MTERETSKILIEPSSKVIETLRLALLDVGLDELVRRTSASPDLLEKWVNGVEWVPLGAVKEACEINRNRQNAPSYSQALSECTAGAQFRITAREEIEKRTARISGEVMPPEPEIPTRILEKQSAVQRRSDATRQVAKVAIAMFLFPLLGAVAGFLVGGPEGAVTGTVSSFVVATALAFLFLVLLPRKMHRV